MFFVPLPTTFTIEEPPPGIILCFDESPDTNDLQLRAITGLQPILPYQVEHILSAFVERAMPDATIIAWLYTGWVNEDGELLGLADGVMVVTTPENN
jgi:hypothetical protein